jgi:hypothetical protein
MHKLRAGLLETVRCAYKMQRDVEANLRYHQLRSSLLKYYWMTCMNEQYEYSLESDRL